MELLVSSVVQALRAVWISTFGNFSFGGGRFLRFSSVNKRSVMFSFLLK